MDERTQRVERWFQWPMIVAAVLVIPAIIFQESGLGAPWTTIGNVLNWVTWLAFGAEMIVMLIVVPNKIDWLRRNPLDVAIVVLTPPVVPPGLQSLRVFRLLRVLRLTRLFTMRDVLSLEGVRDAAVIAAILVLTGGLAFAAIEGVGVWDGIWFAINMVTTVGAANISANTVGAQLIAIVLMFVGIGLVAMVTAFIAERFIHTGQAVEDREDRILSKLEAIEARLDRIETRR